MSSRRFPPAFDRSWYRWLIPCACSAVLWVAPSVARAQDEAVVDALAGVLATEDGRRYDAAVLQRAATYPDPIVRRHAALAMGRIGDVGAIPELLRLLADPDTAVGRDAAFALGLLRDSLAVQPLWALVRDAPADAPPALYEEAITALAKCAAPRRAAQLFEDLWARDMGEIQSGSPPAPAVRAALESWRLGESAPVATLVRLAEVDNVDLRRAAVYSLARLRAPGGIGRLLVATDDDDAEVREFAARGLTQPAVVRAGVEAAALTTRLAHLAEDRDAGVRIQALRALATYHDEHLASVAIDRASDNDLNARIEALAALASLGGPRAPDVFLHAVDRGPFAVRRQALLGLAHTDRRAAIGKSAAWITNDEWRMRAAGAEALGVVAGDTAIAWLASLLRDADGRVAGTALEALAGADSSRARRLAPTLLAHPDPVVRTQALRILAAAPRTDLIDAAVAAYGRALDDPIPDARIAAVELLGAIADRDASARVSVEGQLLRAHRTCADYLVRRAAERSLPGVARRWGPAEPLVTGRSLGDYREIVRSLLLPEERGALVPTLVFDTDRGNITVQLFAADAPITVYALLDLVARRYFDAGTWHRVVPDFVVQDGDPRGDGWGGPGFALRDELNRHRYDRGTVGMALDGPDTGGSQFFITLSPQPHLDGIYTVIGRVTGGMEAVDRTTQGDRIRTVRSR